MNVNRMMTHLLFDVAVADDVNIAMFKSTIMKGDDSFLCITRPLSTTLVSA